MKVNILLYYWAVYMTAREEIWQTQTNTVTDDVLSNQHSKSQASYPLFCGGLTRKSSLTFSNTIRREAKLSALATVVSLHEHIITVQQSINP